MRAKNKPSGVTLKKKNAKEAEAFLKQFANANRLLILCQLVEGEKTIGELSLAVGLSQSALSQHVAKLREAGLVTSQKRGLLVYCRIENMQAQALLSFMHLMFCQS